MDGSGSAASGSGLTDINNLFTDAESPVTTGSDGGILTTVTSVIGGLSTPALAGIAAGGGLLLIIIIVLFIAVSIALVRDKCNKNKVRKVKIRQVQPAQVSWQNH